MSIVSPLMHPTVVSRLPTAPLTIRAPAVTSDQSMGRPPPLLSHPLSKAGPSAHTGVRGEYCAVCSVRDDGRCSGYTVQEAASDRVQVLHDSCRAGDAPGSAPGRLNPRSSAGVRRPDGVRGASSAAAGQTRPFKRRSIRPDWTRLVLCGDSTNSYRLPPVT